jgi:hypothetical protein
VSSTSDFVAPQPYRFIARAARRWRELLAELTALGAAASTAYPVTEWYTGDWNVIPLKTTHDHGIGERAQRELLRANLAACPVAHAVTRFVPGNTLVGFSILEPGCEIATHSHDDGQLICHIGLSIPGACGIRVGDTEDTWREGEALVFDERAPHSAWNRSATPRAAFLFDFTRR